MARSEIDTKVEIVPRVCIYFANWDRKQSNTSWNKQDLSYLSILSLPIYLIFIYLCHSSLFSFLLFLHFSFLLATFLLSFVCLSMLLFIHLLWFIHYPIHLFMHSFRYFLHLLSINLLIYSSISNYKSL